MTDVGRLALLFVVGILAVSASGLTGLVVNEPCTPFEQPGSYDGACPPTCVTCGCCAQAAEPGAFLVSATPDVPIADAPEILPSLPRTAPDDILHVPKLRFA